MPLGFDFNLSSSKAKIFPLMWPAGAILAMGCGGRETTLWPVQKDFFDKHYKISTVLKCT